MVRHIVFFRFENPEENIPIVRDSLYALKDKIPQIVDMQIGADFYARDAKRGVDIARQVFRN